MLGLVAFVMLSPQAQEAVFGEFGGVEEFLQSQMAPYHVYPTEASFTLAKNFDVSMSGSGTGFLTESILIPPTYTSSLSSASQLTYTNGDEPAPSVTIQETLELSVTVAGENINLLLMASPTAPMIIALPPLPATKFGGQISVLETSNALLQSA